MTGPERAQTRTTIAAIGVFVPKDYLGGMNAARDGDEAQRREALAAARDLKDDRTTFASSALGVAANRATDHFAARDAVDPDGEADAIELWGRRIGRALSLAAFIVLSLYLYLTYVN